MAASAAAAAASSRMDEVLSVFNRFDSDGNGTISLADLSSVLQQLDAARFSDETVERIFDAADVNQDGVVDYEEFLQWVFGDDAGRALLQRLRGPGSFRPRDVAGLSIEPAPAEDQELTERLVADPVFSADGDALRGVRAYTATARLGQQDWRVNVAAVECPAEASTGKIALFMHGHGHTCCISTWGRFWAPALRAGFHLLALDAPGFGRSSGAAGQTLPWRDFDADLVIALLRAFGSRNTGGRVTVFGQCMGGAMFLRALQRAPDMFAHRHVLHNCTIGSWPKQLPDVLRAKGGGVFSFWWCDPDHMPESNVYREFTALMARSPELCTFVDLQRDRELPAFFSFARVEEPRLSRGDNAVVLGYCEQAVRDLIAFVTSPPRPRGTGPTAPRKTLLQLGLENADFKVFVRVRPSLRREEGVAPCCVVNDVEDPSGRQVQQMLVQRHEAREAASEFVFERVFRPEASQEDVWTALRGSLDLAGALLEGVGATVFAYGQTGSGKTHTIDGDGSGIVGRLVRDLYGRLGEGQAVRCHYVQLYNEDFLDLFAPPNRLSQDGSGNVVGSKVLEMATAEELLARIRVGAAFRASGATNMNDASSRSHAILGLSIARVGGRSSTEAAQAPPAQLFVVDLAGSERVKKSGVSGAQLAEAVAINQSLLALCNVTQALVENNGRPRAHIPYRDSALTQLLRNSLGGSARTALVACVSPAADSADETLGTLRFAACATHVQNRAGAARQQALEEHEEEKLEALLEGQSVEFRNGEATIATSAGPVHCFGDWSAPDEAPVFVLLHYYGQDAGMWRFAFDRLRAAGCRYLAPNMPGHGSSPGTSSSKPEDYAKKDGPVDILRQILDACGCRRAAVLGYDWGGGIACAFAQRHPGRIQKLMAWCASVREPGELAKLQKRGKRGDIMILWAKNDSWHPFRKGTELAAALGVKVVTEVKLRHKDGGADAFARALDFVFR